MEEEVTVDILVDAIVMRFTNLELNFITRWKEGLRKNECIKSLDWLFEVYSSVTSRQTSWL
jgi:hypothetical protein